MTNLIGVSGRAQHGKDTVGKIIQDLTIPPTEVDSKTGLQSRGLKISPWQIKKFAAALKQIASILTGIPVKDFENIDVKNGCLGDEWNTSVEMTEEGIEALEFGLAHNIGIPERVMTVRELLQKLGTEAIRNGLHTNAWVNALFSTWKPEKMSEYNPSKWIVTDVRFPNEAKAIKDRGGIMIRVNRNKTSFITNTYNKIKSVWKKNPKEHASETALDDYKFDYVIENSGTIEDLVEKVKEILIKEQIIKN